MANHHQFADFPFEVRKVYVQVEETFTDSGLADGEPLRKVTAAVVVRDPLARRRGAELADLADLSDLSEMIADSARIGQLLGERLRAAMAPHAVQAIGKAIIAGINCPHEHGQALVTSTFAGPLRELIGGGKAWISSTLKRGPPGTAIDAPLAHKDALYVRANYDAVEVRVPDAPLPDEIVVIAVAANRGRLHARCGGLSAEDVVGEDGLV